MKTQKPVRGARLPKWSMVIVTVVYLLLLFGWPVSYQLPTAAHKAWTRTAPDGDENCPARHGAYCGHSCPNLDAQPSPRYGDTGWMPDQVPFATGDGVSFCGKAIATEPAADFALARKLNLAVFVVVSGLYVASMVYLYRRLKTISGPRTARH